MNDPNLPPGCSDRDVDRAQGFGFRCPTCGAFDCPDHAGEELDPFEYDCRFDDEGD
jgi:hypothetical protein